MTIRVVREPTIEGVTFSVWFVDGHYECFGLEDAIREVPGQPVDSWKVAGQTAIPAGRYGLRITHSPRFNRALPLLIGVPGFSGVRIHPGNTAVDTGGCLLVGKDRQPGRVLQSRVAFEGLFGQLAAAPGESWIRVENPEA